jgi:hypothetical protein
MNGFRVSVLLGVLLFGLFLSPDCQAQFRQLPIASQTSNAHTNTNNLRIKEGELQLPFWDDFSSGQFSPDLWEIKGVATSFTLGNSPPSLGVAVLDGVDEEGRPYSPQRLTHGEGDQLLSKPIDLSQVLTADGVYLSFYWQAGGKGERPDPSDALELYFLDREGDWQLVWSQQGELDLSLETFVQVMLPVEERFQFDTFQFKFQQSGRLSGPFDTWVLDYIYLNEGRTASDRFPQDRTLTQLPGSPFSPYFAIPYFELRQEQITAPISNEFNNLNNRFRAMEYTVSLSNKGTGELLQKPNTNTPFNPVPQALERRSFVSSSLNAENLVEQVNEPMDVEVLMYLRAGDGLLEEDMGGAQRAVVDFRANDTSKVVIPFRDFYAYDNGTADYAAGINQRGGMLAVSYNVSTPAYLSGVSIQFTNAVHRNNAIELMVWDSIGSEPLYQEEVLVPDDAGLGSFSFFPLDTNILVRDEFFIGYTQFSNDYIYVGLDKSGDTGDKIFYNVLGSWQQNDIVSGNLMIRPHLSLSPIVEENEPSEEELVLYTNPVTARLFILGDVGDVSVFDFQGRLIKIPQEEDKNGKMLNFTESQKGMYLIKMVKNGQHFTKRIIVQ